MSPAVLFLPHCYLRIPSVCCFPFFSTLGLGDILPFQKRFSVEKCSLPGWPACASELAAVVRSGIKNPKTWPSLFAWAVQGVWGCSPRAGRRLPSLATIANSCFFFFAGFLLELRRLCHPGGSHSTHYTHIALVKLMVTVWKGHIDGDSCQWWRDKMTVINWFFCGTAIIRVEVAQVSDSTLKNGGFFCSFSMFVS